MAATKYDLILDTKGHCFLCLNRMSSNLPLPPVGSDPEDSVIYSLHCLFNHLKLDRRKLFHETSPIPSHLLAEVERSEIKASLCEDCASLNEQFSTLNGQLETIKMQMTHCVKEIQQKLLNTDMTSVTEQFQKSSGDLYVDSLEKVEILEAVRKEACQKCSFKANNPVVSIQKLPPAQVDEEVPEDDDENEPTNNSIIDNPQHDHSSRTTTRSKTSSKANVTLVEEPSHSDIDLTCVKMEASLSPAHPFMNFGDSDYEAEENNMENFKEDTEESEFELEKKPKVRRKRQSHRKFGRQQSPRQRPSPVQVKKPGWKKNFYKPRMLPYTFNMETHQYKCNVCPEEFLDYQQFYQHHRRAHRNSRFACTTCGKVFNHLGHLNRHQQEAHTGIRYKCPFCSHCSTQRGNLIRHQQIKAGCMSKLTMEELSKNKKCTCTFCQKDFITLGDLRSHWEATHPPPEEKLLEHLCDLCGKKFLSKSAMKRHRQRLHLGTKFVKTIQKSETVCDICGEKFALKNSLKRHQRRAHREKIEEIIPQTGILCDICGKKFALKNSLKRHQRRAHRGKIEEIIPKTDILCDICGKKFCQNYSLKRHRQTVHKVKGEEASAEPTSY